MEVEDQQTVWRSERRRARLMNQPFLNWDTNSNPQPQEDTSVDDQPPSSPKSDTSSPRIVDDLPPIPSNPVIQIEGSQFSQLEEMALSGALSELPATRLSVAVGLPQSRSELTPLQVVTLLGVPSVPLDLFEAPCLDKKTERDEIAEEIIKTEQAYLRYLLVIKHQFQKPLSEASKQKMLPVTKLQVTTLFGNLDQIIMINTKLLKDLVAKIKGWSDHQQIGEVLQELTPSLKLYGHYLDNYNQALAVLDDIRKNEETILWLKTKIQDPVCDGLSLDALLIQPIQRIPRYRLFLQRLISCTPTDHVDYPNLTVALDHMEEVAVQINTATEIQKERDILLQVLDKFEIITDPLVKPGRKFLAETDIQKVVRKGTAQKRHLYLFNDILIVAHPQIGQFRISTTNYAVLKLKSTVVTDIPDGRYTNLFGISSAEYSFTAVAGSPEHKVEWVNLLSSTIREAQNMIQHKRKNLQSKPVAVSFQPDYEAKSCTLCSEKFTLTYRRHHCRQCGRVACQVCSKYKRELVSKQKQVRVCCVCITKPPDWRPQGKVLERNEQNGTRDETLPQLPPVPGNLSQSQPLFQQDLAKLTHSIKTRSSKIFDRRDSMRESRQTQESRRESLAESYDNSEINSEVSPERTPREKKSREKRAQTVIREKSQKVSHVTKKAQREKSSLQRAITEKNLNLDKVISDRNSIDIPDAGPESPVSPPKSPTRRKITDSGDNIFSSPRRKKGKPQREISENSEIDELRYPKKEEMDELSEEQEHVAYVLKHFPVDGSVDFWLEIISKIASGKLDAKKFPKDRNEINLLENKV